MSIRGDGIDDIGMLRASKTGHGRIIMCGVGRTGEAWCKFV